MAAEAWPSMVWMTQPGELTPAQAAVRADEHEGAIAVVDGVGECGDLVGGEEAHLASFDLRRLDTGERVAHEHLALQGGTEHAPKAPVGRVDAGRCEVTRRQFGEPPPQVGLGELAERHGAEARQHAEPQVVLVDPAGRRAKMDDRAQPLVRSRGERHAGRTRIDPAAVLTEVSLVALVGLGRRTGSEGW